MEELEIQRLLGLLNGFRPVERVLLSSAGTLQTVLSALFNEPVKVKVVEQYQEDDVIHRKVDLVAGDRVVCKAESEISVVREDVRSAILAGNMGLGQILSHLNIRPSFRLLEVGGDEDIFWRVYKLEAPGVSYTIKETFSRGLYGFS